MAFTYISTDADGRQPDTLKESGSYEPIVVLELFTSQGCSSCPSADRLLNQIKKAAHKNVFTLSYHVDYWNYIGWEDPFSKPQFAKKQRLYNAKFRNRSNYTPQVVVNGKEHFVGSNSSKMNSKIREYKLQKSANQINLSGVEQAGKTLRFDYELLVPLDGNELRALLILDERITEVERGENRNRTLTNANIVVAEHIEAVTARKGSIEMAVPNTVFPREKIRLVILTENQDYDITAAATSGVLK